MQIWANPVAVCIPQAGLDMMSQGHMLADVVAIIGMRLLMQWKCPEQGIGGSSGSRNQIALFSTDYGTGSRSPSPGHSSGFWIVGNSTSLCALTF